MTFRTENITKKSSFEESLNQISTNISYHQDPMILVVAVEANDLATLAHH
jgi:hypothetical protein